MGNRNHENFSYRCNRFYWQSFGGAPGASGGGRQRGRDIETSVTLSFEDAIFGTEKKISLSLEDECEHCHGDGAEPGFGVKTCPTCKGAGQQTRVMNSLFALCFT